MDNKPARASYEYRGVIIFRNSPGYALRYSFRIEGEGRYSADTLEGAKRTIREVLGNPKT